MRFPCPQVWITLLLLFLSLNKTTLAAEDSFSFALIGDLEYDSSQEEAFAYLQEDINQDSSIQFVIHDGDFKSGISPCSDEIFRKRLEEFNHFLPPFILLLGDNEWTDCHRPKAGGYRPLERLAKLRQLFTPYSIPKSLGLHPLSLERQSEQFPENIRWTYGSIVFVGLNIPGSNNGLLTDPRFEQESQEEFILRNAANIRWLKESFELAKKNHAPALLLSFQANPWDRVPTKQLTGYQEFLGVLEQETRTFYKPVVLVHGDSHYFRIDKPLPSPPFEPSAQFQRLPWESIAPRIENFTRVETFGFLNTHWIKVTANPHSTSVFQFEEKIVSKNRGSGEINFISN